MSVDRALLDIDRCCSSDCVIRDLEIREAHASDESEARPIVPHAVLYPTRTQDVARILEACHRHRIAITPRGGGTGRVGGAVPVSGGLTLSTVKMNELKGIEKEDLQAVVGPGLILKNLHHSVEQEGLFYPPDPNSLEGCLIGGNIATNAGGPRAFKYGVTRNWVLRLEIVTADGSILRVGRPTAKALRAMTLRR